MRVQIDEARRDDQSGSVNHLRAFRSCFRAIEETGDATVFKQKISAGVDFLRRIDHVPVCDQ